MRTSLASVVLFLFLSLTSVTALSYSVCDNLAAEYTTASPQLTGTWPYYSLLYTCSGNITIEGFQVDACVNSGKSCGQAAADALCQYLGFDSNAQTLYSTVTGTAPAISLTGEWCASPGNYANFGHPNRTQFDTILEMNQGPYCSVLSSVSCIRSRTTLAAAVPTIQQIALSAAATPPNAQLVPGAAYLIANSPPVSTAGRKMKGVASIVNKGCGYLA